MTLSTRGVLALVVVALMTAALAAARADREPLASWLMTIGFAAATLWAGLGVAWTWIRGDEGSMSPQLYLTLVTIGIAFTVYFGLRASDATERAGDWG